MKEIPSLKSNPNRKAGLNMSQLYSICAAEVYTWHGKPFFERQAKKIVQAGYEKKNKERKGSIGVILVVVDKAHFLVLVLFT